MNKHTRIELNDSKAVVLLKITEGNPGALRVVMDLMDCNHSIDPMDFARGLGPLLAFDNHGIYGSQIWGFYKDVCGENYVNVLTALRCAQMGIILYDSIAESVQGPQRGSDKFTPETFRAMYLELKKQLPEFDPEGLSEFAVKSERTEYEDVPAATGG